MSILIACMFFWISDTYAQSPSISTFVASPSLAASGDIFNFAWALENAGGYSFSVPCYAGIKIKYTSGSTLTCGSKVSTTAKINDTFSFRIYNTSGYTRTVTAKLTPKNTSGQDVDVASKEISVNVLTVAEPIISFSASASSTLPEQMITLTWKLAAGVDGVNLQIECKTGIKATSTSYSGILPCGKPIFSKDLGPASKLILSFTNSLADAMPITLTLLPAIVPGSYDSTHAANLELTIASDIPKDPSVSYFAASSTIANSYEPVVINWTSVDSKGANIIISCKESITATSSKNPAVLLPCDKLAFSDSLSASGNLKLFFRNTGTVAVPVSISLLPSKTVGTYDLTRSKNISISIKPESENNIISPLPPPPSVIPSATSTITPPPPAGGSKTLTPPPPSTGGIAPKPSTGSGTVLPQPSPISSGVKSSPGAPPTKDGSAGETTAVIKTESDIQEKLLAEKEIDVFSSIEFVSDESVYEIKGLKRKKLLFFIPIDAYIELRIDAKTAEILSIKKPWWSFLAR